MAKQKYYVVWSGRSPGIYNDWSTCKAQVEGVAGARYKSFPTMALAEEAFAAGAAASVGKTGAAPGKKNKTTAVKTYDAAEVDAISAPLKIFTDGGCEPNPGEAGTGVAIYRHSKLSELWYGLYNASGTNNTAELNGLLQGLLFANEAVKNKINDIVIFSDSRYAIQCITQWAAGWERRGWTRPSGEIKNLELIKETYSLYQTLSDRVRILHVNGHVGVVGNELADRMSIVAIQRQIEDFRMWQETMDVEDILALRAG